MLLSDQVAAESNFAPGGAAVPDGSDSHTRSSLGRLISVELLITIGKE